MVLKVAPCEDNDMERAFTILSLAFGHEHSYIDAVYPDHDTPLGRRIGGERFIAVKKSDPNTHFIKVFEEETGHIIAMAKWNVYDGAVPEDLDLDGDFWKSEEDKEYAQHLCREFLRLRRKAIKDSNGHLVSLDITVVDPQFQRQGAGRLLVQWGTKVADKMGVKAVVEASTYARSLYLSEGFEVVNENCVIDLPKKWEAREKQTYIWMVRPAKAADIKSTQ